MRPFLLLACLALSPARCGRADRRPGRSALHGGARRLARRRRAGRAARARRPRCRGQPRRPGARRADRPGSGLPGTVAGERDRKERLALTRAPGGLSGRSWMAEAAADTPLAALWLERDGTDTTVETALAFVAWARTAPPARRCRRWRRASIAASPPPPMIRATPRTCGTSSGASGPARRAAGRGPRPRSRRCTPGDPQIRRFADRPVSPAEIDAWLATAPLAAPLRATCAEVCPASPVTCRRAAFLLVEGHALLAEFGTPSETLIPPEIWNASPRGRKALLRVPSARFRFAYVMAVAVARRGRLPRRRARRRGRPLLP